MRDATQPSQPCAQRSAEEEIDNEDCFYLHVTVPRFSRDEGRKPVMVWIHGGGMSSGSGSEYDARRISLQGVLGAVSRVAISKLIIPPVGHVPDLHVLLGGQEGNRRAP
jgi:para-nitrobenzyl esterase